MRSKLYPSAVSGVFALVLCSFCSCAPEKKGIQEISFTRVDSLTGEYLELQDSLLQSWNMMINDDNRKIQAMHSLVRELRSSPSHDHESLTSLEDRLRHLRHMRFDQCTMADQNIIEEYDFATNSLVTELISLAESQASFSDNKTLQDITEEIRLAEQRISIYRSNYDNIAARYNLFVKENKDVIKEIDDHLSNELKPLFQMVSEGN